MKLSDKDLEKLDFITENKVSNSYRLDLYSIEIVIIERVISDDFRLTVRCKGCEIDEELKEPVFRKVMDTLYNDKKKQKQDANDYAKWFLDQT